MIVRHAPLGDLSPTAAATLKGAAMGFLFGAGLVLAGVMVVVSGRGFNGLGRSRRRTR